MADDNTLGKEFKLPATYVGLYPKWNAETKTSYDVFKYAITGSPEAIARYEQITLEKGYPVHKHDDGRLLYFTLDYAGPKGTVKITRGGAIVMDDETLRQLNSLARRTSGVMQDKIAEKGAEMLLGQLFGAPVANTPAGTTPVNSVENTEEAPEITPEEADLESTSEE